MTLNWITLVSFAVVMTTGLFSSQVTKAQSESPPSPANPTEVEIPPSPEQMEKPAQPTVPNSTDTNFSCQERYFPSAFKDVPPDAWAYQAVIQLASPPLECFPSAPEQ